MTVFASLNTVAGPDFVGKVASLLTVGMAVWARWVHAWIVPAHDVRVGKSAARLAGGAVSAVAANRHGMLERTRLVGA